MTVQPCPKCRAGKPVQKFNRSPRSWLECDNCGWHLTDGVECWNDVAGMACEPAAVPELLKALESLVAHALADEHILAKARAAIAKARPPAGETK